MLKGILLLAIGAALFASFNVAATSDKCGVNLVFKGIPTTTQNTLELSDKVSLFTKNYLHYQSVKGARIAANVSCQSLSGANYSGTDPEWQNIFKTTLSELSAQGYNNLNFLPLTQNNKNYKSELENKEYIIEAFKGDNQQVLYNLNILSTDKSTLYTIVVSGDSSVRAEIKTEFISILTTFTLPKVSTNKKSVDD